MLTSIWHVDVSGSSVRGAEDNASGTEYDGHRHEYLIRAASSGFRSSVIPSTSCISRPLWGTCGSGHPVPQGDSFAYASSISISIRMMSGTHNPTRKLSRTFASTKLGDIS